jgi:hypothetical protein
MSGEEPSDRGPMDLRGRRSRGDLSGWHASYSHRIERNVPRSSRAGSPSERADLPTVWVARGGCSSELPLHSVPRSWDVSEMHASSRHLAES